MLNKCKDYANEGYVYAVDMDLEKLFDTVNQSKLIEVLSRTIKDGRVISLIHKYLNAGVVIAGRIEEAEMFEPAETESIDTLNEVAEKMTLIFEEARRDPDALHNAPTKTPVGRADEVLAARNLVLKYNS